MTKGPLRSWEWSDGGAERFASDLAETGFSWFRNSTALEEAADPVALAQRLFGRRPYRFQRMDIVPDTSGFQRRLPNTMMEGALHNDCAFPFMPPHVQVMICVRPAASGGETRILDLWPVLESIEKSEPDLFESLFRHPRIFVSGHFPLFGTTFSLQRGSLVARCPSLTSLRDDTVGHRFHRWIAAADTCTFRCDQGDVYVNDNHRSLHGRSAFDDPERHFVRFLYWFHEPFPAPKRFVEAAIQGSANLAESMKRYPPWVRQRFGVDCAAATDRSIARALEALQLLAHPTNIEDWPKKVAVMRRQELLLSCLHLFAEELPGVEEQQDTLVSVLREITKS